MMPPPYPKSGCLYTISGRPVGALEKAIKALHPSYTPNCSISDHAALQSAFDNEKARCMELQEQLAQTQARVVELEKQIAEMNDQLRQQGAAALSAVQLLEKIEVRQVGQIFHTSIMSPYSQKISDFPGKGQSPRPPEFPTTA
jgi:TolA-binding protein